MTKFFIGMHISMYYGPNKKNMYIYCTCHQKKKKGLTLC